MKRDEIRAIVNEKLADVGFDPAVFRWVNRPAQLELLVGDTVRIVSLKSGMSRRQLDYEFGRIEGWADRREQKRTAKARKERGVETSAISAQIDLEELTGAP